MCMCFKDHLDAQECKQDKSTFETPVDFEEEILDAEVEANEAIPLSDEEIALDAASSEGSMSRPDSRGEEAEFERIELGAIGLDYNGISRSKFFNHSSSLPAAARATNAYSIIEPVIQNVSEATAKEIEVTAIPDKNFFDIDELLGNINQKGQYDAWFENNVDGFDFDFLDTEFEDYNFTLEELGISLDPAKPVM
nr:hypothetical protein [Tanacetum cinerariifolium]